MTKRQMSNYFANTAVSVADIRDFYKDQRMLTIEQRLMDDQIPPYLLAKFSRKGGDE